TVAVTTCDVEQSVTAPGSLINTREVKLEMPANGRLAEILVRAGDRVSAGQTVGRLADPEKFAASVAAAELALLEAQKTIDDLYQNLPLQLAQAQVALAEAQKALIEAQKERTRLDYPRASATTIDEAEARLALADEHLELAQDAYHRVDDLPASDPERATALLNLSGAQRERQNVLATLNWYLGNPSENEIALADANLAQAEVNLAEAQKELDTLSKGPDPLDLKLAEAKLASAKAALVEAQDAVENEEIKAPFDGVILEVNARAGETIPAGTGLFVIIDPQAAEVETTVIEEDLPFVQVGQPASLYFDALPVETLTGTVARIVPRRAPGDRPLYYVYITLEHVPSDLVAGMSADASIVIAERQGVLCLPRALAQASGDGRAFIDVWANGQVEKHTVEVGLRGDSSVEILSGLKEGDLVVAR
ncbi:MAG: efflux RND transporter periplasmic adaptor subunit, partial [Chloroflexota bacterium]